MDFGKNAQGTIEYLVILGIVLVISLGLAGVILGQSTPVIEISSTSNEINSKGSLISISDAVVDPDGGGIITLSNNSGENFTITKVTVGGKDYNYGVITMPLGDKKSFLLDDLNSTCTCEKGNAGKNKCTYSIFVKSDSGLDKEYTYYIDVDCVEKVEAKVRLLEPLEEDSSASGGEPMGDVVEFVKTDYGTEEDCIIPSVCITRGDYSGLYNSASEDGYSLGSPAGTEWNFLGPCTGGMMFLPWRIALSSALDIYGAGNVPLPSSTCLHIISNNTYYDINFESWTSGGGGGFSYKRQQVTPLSEWEEPSGAVYFSKQDNATGNDAMDCITPNVCITRDDTGALYSNPSDDAEWSFEGYCNNVISFDSFSDAISSSFSRRIPPVAIGHEACLHLITDNVYYDVILTSWTSGVYATTGSAQTGVGGGGGFSYYRKISTGPVFSQSDTPTGLTATSVSSSVINLSWTDNCSKEEGYKIERSLNQSNWSEIGTTDTNTTYVDSGLSSGVTYYYRVRAYTSEGSSAYSGTAYAAPGIFGASTPTSLVATVLSDTIINLRWTDNSSDELGFYIERSLDQSSWTQIGIAAADQADYNNTGLSETTQYYYRVKMYKADGNSFYSNVASGTTQMTPRLIFTCADLNAMRDNLNAIYTIQNDINCSATRTWNSGAGFEPIGNDSTSFGGKLYGNNHKITGLYIYRPSVDMVGLIGKMGGTDYFNYYNWSDNPMTINYPALPWVTNVYLEDVNITGKDYTGGLIGYKSNGVVSGSYVTGKVWGTGYQTGGFMGVANGIGYVDECYFSGNVLSFGGAGGLMYFTASDNKVTNCYSKGTVTGGVNNDNSSYRTGGLIGSLELGGTVYNSYSTADVAGDNALGGLVGGTSAWSVVSNSYATGKVMGGSKIGGLVGWHNQHAYIENSYATGDTNGWWEIGGLVGYNSTSNDTNISNSFATGRVTCLSGDCGGLIGKNESGITLNSYFDITRTGMSVCCGSGTCTSCFGKNNAGSETDAFYPKAGLGDDYNVPMQHNSNSAYDWNFTGIWQRRDGNYPLLR